MRLKLNVGQVVNKQTSFLQVLTEKTNRNNIRSSEPVVYQTHRTSHILFKFCNEEMQIEKKSELLIVILLNMILLILTRRYFLTSLFQALKFNHAHFNVPYFKMKFSIF